MRRLDYLKQKALVVLAAVGIFHFLSPYVSGANPETPKRDWKEQPAIVEIDTEEDIYGLGDVHGDYERLITLLETRKLIEPGPAGPAELVWVGGKSVLICAGDLIDKSDESVRVLEGFIALQASAQAAGGRVIVTMGNHEAEFLSDPDSSKVQSFVAELRARNIEVADVIKGKDSLGLGQFLLGMPLAARANDWFFVHAGVNQAQSLESLREKIEKGVDADGYGTDILLGEKTGILEVRMSKRPWWEEKKDKPDESRDRLARIVRELGVSHIGFGHQNNEYKFSDGTVRPAGEMFQKYGLAFLIDVGESEAINRSDGALLFIHHSGHSESATALYLDETVHLWPSPPPVIKAKKKDD